MRDIATVHLGEFADEDISTLDLVTAFLEEVGTANRPQIVGAVDRVWAGVSGALDVLILEGRVNVDTSMRPYVYTWAG